MGVKQLLRSIVLTLRLSRKSDRREFMLYLKLVFLGLLAVGTVGFIVKFVAALIELTVG